MPRKRIEWKLKTGAIRLGERTLIAGTLCVAPDAPAGSGGFGDPDKAYARALELAGAGADFVGISAESFHAGSARVSEAEELRRLVPALKRLKNECPVPICVETSRPAVAEKAFALGAEIVRDPSGLTFEPDLAGVVSRHNAALILQHMRGRPESWQRLGSMADPAGAVTEELRAALGRAIRAGIDKHRLVVNPGLGMGKRKEQNSEILLRLDLLAGLDAALEVSPDGQAFLASPPVEPGTATATAGAVMAVLRGAHIVCLSAVEAILPAIRVADAVLLQSDYALWQRGQ
jgi:dihydropteroate synthase